MHMYTSINFPSKAAAKRALLAGERVALLPNGLEPGVTDGTATVEGPWYPEPHSWCATVTVVNGYVTKIK